MSGSDYWLNRVGAVATAATPSGSVPSYGLAFDVGTAKWPDASTFNQAVNDMAVRRRSQDIAALEAAKAKSERGWARELISGTGQALIEGVGFIAGGPFQEMDEGTAAENRERGMKTLRTIGETPVIKQMGQAWNFASNVIETPLIIDRNTAMQGELGLWLDKSAWAEAWRESDDRTFGQALIEALSTGEGTTHKDLDRIRRTNNLYAITTLAADLVLEWKFDPTVLALKGVGEVKRIKTGQLSALPSGKLRDTTALRAARNADYRYTGLDPRGHYGTWRGRQVGSRMDRLFDFAAANGYYDVANLPMFKRRATHGAQAALAVKIAAADPKLRDLTKRLLLADPEAIIEVNRLKKDPLALREYAPDAATFVDALEGTKTRIKSMEKEISDLEKTIAKRGESLSQAKNPGFFEYRTWELSRDLEGKVADLTEAQTRLDGYDDYATWLDSVMDQRSVFANVEQINIGQVPKTFAGLSQRTYSKSPYGVRHTITESSKAAWMRQAQPIDLHDPDSGFMSLKRQFEQMEHLFGYRLPRAGDDLQFGATETLDDIFERFARAKDPTERFKIAQAIEDYHLPQAISEWTKRTHPGTEGLSPDTIRIFFERVQFKRNEMAHALLSGKGAIYSTWPGDSSSAKLVDVKDGIAQLEFMDNGDRVTIRVPEEALKTQNFANDPTQTPNFYQPLDAQMVKAAINREWSLFEELEGQVRLNGRKGSAWIFNNIDKYGTAWNSFWKPLQLFRLAWPQRVLMDEGFRGLAVLGVSEFSRTYGPAFVAASLNAVNPAKHNFGIGKRIAQRNLRRNVKIGPGPLADELTGRSVDIGAHEAFIDAAPYVPERFVPRRNPARTRAVNDYLYQAGPARRMRAKARALLRNPNRGWSLADDGEQPYNWISADDILGNEQGRLLMGDEMPVNDGLTVSRTDPEDFTSDDFDLAVKGYELTAEDVMAELSGQGTSDVIKMDRFLQLPDEVRAAIWNNTIEDLPPGDMLRTGLRNFGDILDEFLPGGRMRPIVREAVAKGKKNYADELASRQTGAGRKPYFSGVFHDVGGPHARVEIRMARELGAKWVPVNERLALNSEGSHVVRRGDLWAQFEHPVYKQIAKARWDATEGFEQGGRFTKPQNVTRVFDHTTGKLVKKGYVVRVAEVETPNAPTSAWRLTGSEELDMIDDLIAHNEDFLGSTNYRIMVQVQGDGRTRVSVVRYFTEAERAAAIDFGRYVGAKSIRRLRGNAPARKPAGVAKGDQTNIQVGSSADDAYPSGYELYYQDPNDLSPIMEEVQRQFAQQYATGDTLDDALPPGEGIEQSVLHGTSGSLAEDLLGRHEAPIVNGRAYGPGFYTTISKDLAERFGENLYMVKGSKNGRTYNVLDLDGTLPEGMADQIRADFLAWAESPEIQALARQHMIGDEWNAYIETIRRIGDTQYGDTLLAAFVFSDISSTSRSHLPYELTSDNWLADWMLEHGYGAYKSSGFGTDAMVYIWLDPENLVVRPAYIGVDKWFSLEEWFANPDSAERLFNRVPESRILRERRPNPELLKLHQRTEARLRKYGPSDPVYHALRAQEDAMRQRLTPQLEAPPRQAPAPMTVEDLPLRELDDVHNTFARRLYRRLTNPGKGTTVVKSADGRDVEYQQFFEGEGELMVPHVSAAPVFRRLTDSYKRTLSRMQTRAVGYKRYLPPDVSPEALSKATGRKAAMEYLSEWADLINDQIRNSPIYYKMLAGESDDAILAWLKNTDEGARIRRSQPGLGRNPEVWIETHRQRLDFYIPDTNLQAKLAQRKLSPSDLSKVDGNLWPEVYGPDLMDSGGALAHARDKIYNALGTVPVDVLSRQPFARSMYDLKMRNLIGAADAEFLTPEVMLAYQRTARAYAIKQLRRTMFDLSEETNFGHAIRFMAPFWGAQQEAIVKWLNIIVDKPETVARFYLGMEGLYRNFVVINEDGEEVIGDRGFIGYDPNDRVIIQIPENLRKLPVFKQALGEWGSVGIPLGSANTVLQGDNPMLPGLGPIVTVPADWLATQMWDTYGTQFDDNFFYRWLFPVGRPRGEGFVSRTMESIFPGWGRRLKQIAEGEDSITYTNTMFTVMREMQADHKKRGLPPPTPEEIQRATNWHYGLRVIASFGAPFAMQFRPKNQMFLDAYHEKLREVGPARAFEEFYKEYGADATAYAASSSDGLVPPTAQGMAEWSQNKQLIQSLSELGFSDLAAAVISPDAWADDFSSDAYSQQFYINLGPGSDKNLRESWSPAEREAETQRRVGWIQYRQFMAGINAELYNLGLTSLDQSGAEELADHRRAFIADLERTNPAWRKDYRDFSDTIYQQVDLLEEFAFEPRFDNRPDIQGLRQYLMIRDRVANALDAYAADTGGSRSLQSEENSELRAYFYDQVGQLIQANPAFGEFYSRFLDADRLERGSGP